MQNLLQLVRWYPIPVSGRMRLSTKRICASIYTPVLGLEKDNQQAKVEAYQGEAWSLMTSLPRATVIRLGSLAMLAFRMVRVLSHNVDLLCPGVGPLS